MQLWYRHEGDSYWHTGCAVGASFVTLCNGRWPLADGDAVEHMEQPPHDERCDACQRQRIDQHRVELGLRELAAAAPTERQIAIHDRFDLGGEG